MADALHASNSKIQLDYIGQGSGLERDILGKSVNYYRISAGKFRRYHDETYLQKLLDIKTNALNFRDGFRVLLGVGQAWRLLGKIRPNAVFVKGGYVGLPVGLAAHLRRIPIIIHESDARPGLTNRVLGKYAHIIATGFPAKTYHEWKGKPVVFTGNPIRDSMLNAKPGAARRTLKLSTKAKVVLIMGGSSGSAAINAAIEENIEKLCSNYEVFHITGSNKGKLKKTTKNYHQYEFVTDKLALLLAASDCVVARAGMNTVTEVAAYRKPLVVIPAPHLTDQTLNAAALVDANSAILINQQELSAQLPDVLEQLFSSVSKRQGLSRNIASFYRPRAAVELANIIIQSAHG